MANAKAFRIYSEDNKISGRFETVPIEEIGTGDVWIKVAYSSINYKDALAATGKGKIIRSFPRIGGIDLAGTVMRSEASQFAVGDRVLVTGYGIGEAYDGGYTEVARVKSEWVVPVPEQLSLRDCMALGTAGFTAAQCVDRLELLGVTPSQGKVAVTGATGGVGSLATNILASRGFEVAAITGKREAVSLLQELGAKEILFRDELQLGSAKPLESAQFAGAVDTAGGAILSWLTKVISPFGAISACGLVGGIEIATTVMPFILRGISLLGVDSVYCPMEWRLKIWQRLATDLHPPLLDKLVTEIAFEDLPNYFESFIAGKAKGRIVVKISE